MGSSNKVAPKQPARAQEPSNRSSGLAGQRSAQAELIIALVDVDEDGRKLGHIGDSIRVVQRPDRAIVVFSTSGVYLGAIPRHAYQTVVRGQYLRGAIKSTGDAPASVRVRLVRGL